MKKPTDPSDESLEEMPEIEDERFRRHPGRGHHVERDGSITHEELKVRLAMRIVGGMAMRGESRAAILAEYPDLQDEDIALARGLIAAGYPLMSAGTPNVDTARFRHRDADKPIVISDFDRWVGDNNIPEAYEYSKGWWDYVELVRRFASRYETEDVRVIGHYVIDTPPPCERLPMPAVAISIPGLTVALRFDFGSWSLKHREPSEWV